MIDDHIFCKPFHIVYSAISFIPSCLCRIVSFIFNSFSYFCPFRLFLLSWHLQLDVHDSRLLHFSCPLFTESKQFSVLTSVASPCFLIPNIRYWHHVVVYDIMRAHQLTCFVIQMLAHLHIQSRCLPFVVGDWAITNLQRLPRYLHIWQHWGYRNIETNNVGILHFWDITKYIIKLLWLGTDVHVAHLWSKPYYLDLLVYSPRVDLFSFFESTLFPLLLGVGLIVKRTGHFFK